MESIFVIGVPTLAAWALWVAYRCISESAIRVLRLLAMLMTVGLIAGIVIGGRAAIVALTADAAIVVVVEAMLASNAIPSVRGLWPLFKYLPIDLRILAEGPTEIYRTNAARKLDGATLAAIAAHKPSAKSKEVTRFRLDTPESEIVKIYGLQSGVAVLTEQSDEIRQLQHQLESQHNRLLHQIAFLKRRNEMQSILYRQQRERELGERVENDLRATTAQIKQILDDLEARADDLTDEERLQQLNLIKVLTAYCKRKGMLILASVESDMIAKDQISTISREAMIDLRSVGIECAILVAVEDGVSIGAFNLAYDAFYECIIAVLPRTRPVLMAYLCQNGASLEARISIECAIGLNSETAIERIPQRATSTEPLTELLEEIVVELDERLAKRELAYSIGLTDNLVSIVMLIGGDRI